MGHKNMRCLIAGVIAVLSLNACGFQPLYGPNSDLETVEIQSRLEQIKVSKLPHREGLILRNYILDKLNPSGEPSSPEMALDIDLKLEKEITSLRRDGTSQRYNTIATVDLRLYRLDPSSPEKRSKKNLLYEDQIIKITSYSIGQSATEPGYPGTVADRDSRKRVLKLVADDVQLMLATYMARWQGKPLVTDAQVKTPAPITLTP